MLDLNRVFLIGRTGLVPELKQTKSGDPVTNLRIATTRRRRQDDTEVQETEWHDVVVFGKMAANCCQFLDKGRLVFIEGRLRSNVWQDKHDQKRLSREIVARRVDFLDRASKPSHSEGAPIAAMAALS